MLPVAVFVCLGWIVSVCIHEFGHAVVAYWGGDTSVKDKGYLTLNPLKYTDPTLSLVLPVVFLLIGGIALPGAAVYINQSQLRNRWWKSAVSAAGPIASVIVTLLLTIPFWLGWVTPFSQHWIGPALAFLIILQISVIQFNFLPIPPLDGYGIIEPWLPNQTQIKLRKLSKYGIIALFILLSFVKPLNLLFWKSAFTIGALLGVPMELVWKGYASFNADSGILLLAAIGVFLLIRRVMNPHHACYEKGNQLLKSQRYEEAIAFYDKAIKLKHDFWEAWHHRAWALGSLQRYKEAIASYEQAIVLKPDNPAIWTDWSGALAALQRYEEAIACCDRAIEINPHYPYAWYNKACFCALQGKASLALDSLEQAIYLDPNTFKTYAKNESSFYQIRQHERFKKMIGEL
ncbi:tetratricopeptide repeat protein [Coleofasciculus sp. FACHB-712]|uniref:tetratricopeptide repeat protein n=1 Tax=Coleofasciculus sp. FACHB-712 TaxID=2692789 RepID=UPI00168369E0|nr:tetratricopeptide repeat protein [Coleofasciculus sp. FACHB-712]MBD1945205.1 tetratricopeptide repeat protein [Coleofasciculus sp. FACHB-712]